MVNAELVRQGFAPAATYPPNVKHQDLFLTRQREARALKRGPDGAGTAVGEADGALAG